MKNLLFLLLLIGQLTAAAQSNCLYYKKYVATGDAELKKGSQANFEAAINAYSTAMLHCPDKAEEAREKILAVFKAIEKLKTEAEKAQKQSLIEKNNAETAQKKAVESDSLTKIALAQADTAKTAAQTERDRALTALGNLETANASTVALLLQNADRDILNLHFEDALQKIKAAASLGALKPEVAKAYLEMAFWHGETGNTRRAAALLDSIADFTKNTAVSALLQQLPADTAAARNRLREAMKVVDARHFAFLFEQKYYPDMVPVPGGKFMMGCDSKTEPNCQSNETLHEQEVSSFQMARTETTVWQFALYCAAKGLNINDFLQATWSDPGDNPVVNVSWFQAVEYANWVSRQKGKEEAIPKDEAKKYAVRLRAGYRLPTEAEWEYAAKGGAAYSKTIYSGSNDLDSVGWYAGGRTHAVGKKKANALDLYDMSGNVWEWCWDWYDSYKSRPEKDYEGPTEGSFRVFRGGSWFDLAEFCRSAFRYYYYPVDRYPFIGFRLVFVP